MSVVDCPCGQDCYAYASEEDRHFAEETIHWKQSASIRDAEKIGGIVGDRIVRGIKASQRRMAYARDRFIEHVLGRRLP